MASREGELDSERCFGGSGEGGRRVEKGLEERALIQRS